LIEDVQFSHLTTFLLYEIVWLLPTLNSLRRPKQTKAAEEPLMANEEHLAILRQGQSCKNTFDNRL